MPPEMAVSMRHTKLKAEEAALLAGELKKPTWESRNEGIHERVSFEDTIWGFDLAGGSYYKTPLRVTHVKEDSRAAKAGIRPGDRLKRINDIDTSTLTIQEAHEIILESGIHLKIAVTAPEDEEDAYFCYEDPIDDGYDSEEERRREEERARKRVVHARVSSYWSLQWPWVSKRRVIYRESNCFMVPSKYEEKHKEKFPPVPFLRTSDDVVLDNLQNLNLKNEGSQENNSNLPKPETNTDVAANAIEKPAENSVEKSATENPSSISNGAADDKEKQLTNGEVNENSISSDDGQMNGLENIPEIDEDKIPVTPEPQDDSIQEISEADSVNVSEEAETPVVIQPDDANGTEDVKDDDVIHEVLNGDDVSDLEEEKILDSILSDSHEEDTIDER